MWPGRLAKHIPPRARKSQTLDNAMPSSAFPWQEVSRTVGTKSFTYRQSPSPAVHNHGPRTTQHVSRFTFEAAASLPSSPCGQQASGDQRNGNQQDEGHAARAGADLEHRDNRPGVYVPRSLPGGGPLDSVTKTHGDPAQLPAGSLVLVSGEILVHRLQAMPHHPDRGAFRAV